MVDPGTAQFDVDVGLTARLAFASPLCADGVSRIVDWVIGCTGEPSLAFEWRTADGARRRTQKLNRALDAVAAGDLDLLHVRPHFTGPDDVVLPFAVTVGLATAGKGTSQVKFRWTVMGPPAEPPRVPDWIDPEIWIRQVAVLAAEFNTVSGYVDGHEYGSVGVFVVHDSLYSGDSLGVIAGYRWFNILNDSLMTRLDAVEVARFPWYEVWGVESVEAGRLHCLRATRYPSEMTPELWSRLRLLLGPLLPSAQYRTPRHLIRAWDHLAPEDIDDSP